jgi:hypothetical protein
MNGKPAPIARTSRASQTQPGAPQLCTQCHQRPRLGALQRCANCLKAAANANREARIQAEARVEARRAAIGAAIAPEMGKECPLETQPRKALGAMWRRPIGVPS